MVVDVAEETVSIAYPDEGWHERLYLPGNKTFAAELAWVAPDLSFGYAVRDMRGQTELPVEFIGVLARGWYESEDGRLGYDLPSAVAILQPDGAGFRVEITRGGDAAMDPMGENCGRMVMRLVELLSIDARLYYALGEARSDALLRWFKRVRRAMGM